MKKIMIIAAISIFSIKTQAQAYEIQQLILDIEKLAQFKQILSDLKKGYDILVKGYGAIKNISEGNFNLHQTFLDGLLQVSPSVQKYKRITSIVDYQLKIVKQYKEAFNRFKTDNNFTAAEINYMEKVYDRLFRESLKNLDDLAMVITAGKLRMSDNERLEAIDRVFSEMEGLYGFLNDFNNSTMLLSIQRQKEKQDVEADRQLFDIK